MRDRNKKDGLKSAERIIADYLGSRDENREVGMRNRIALLSVAVIVLGMFAMPATLSLFSGQHSFKNAIDVRSDTGCRKCHEDIYEEMHNPQNQVHWNIPGVKGTDDVFRCNECHNATLNFTYEFLYNNVPSGTRPSAHAAQTVACLECHGDASAWTPGTDFSNASNPMHRLANKYLKGPQTAGSGPNTCGQCHLDNNGDEAVKIFGVDSKITGSQEAHVVFFNQSKYPDNQSAIRLKESNTACVGCHTHTGINVTWVRARGYNLFANMTTGGYVLNFSANQTQGNIVETSSAGE